MSVRLSDDEAWAEMTAAHTGIFTTLRRDGRPVSLPTWFVVEDRTIYMQTPEGSKKVRRIRHDDRGSFLVERGERWAELAAVQLAVRASLVADEEERGRVLDLMADKYRSFRTPSRQMPDATRSHYGAGTAVIRLAPDGKLLTWDNSRIRLRTD